MVDIEKISGMGEYSVDETILEGNIKRVFYKINDHVFLVVNKNTIEVRTDEKLGKFLIGKYESVMRSRYFGKGGIEIVDTGQLGKNEIEDLIRLSYNMTKELERNE